VKRFFVLPVQIAVLALAAVVTACDGAGDGGGAPTSSPATATLAPSKQVTATGKIFFVASDGNLASINPDGTGDQRVTESASVAAFEFSAAGSIALEINGDPDSTVRVIDAAGQQLFEVAEASDPLWSPSGSQIVVARRSDLLVLDAAGQEVLTIRNATRPAWSPDGGSLAIIKLNNDGSGVPFIVEISTGKEAGLDETAEPHDPVFPLAWHPAGAIIAYRDTVYDISSGTAAPLPGRAVSFSPDGRMLLVALSPEPGATGTPARLLDMTQNARPIIGLDIRPAPDDTSPWLYIQLWTDWSRDGRLLYMDPDPARPRARIYDTVAITQKTYKDIAGERPRISPDGTHATFTYNGKVWVFALDGSVLADIAGGSSPNWQPGDR